MWCVFFFKQKTAFDIYYGLVGSEMCIRDSLSLSLTLSASAQMKRTMYQVFEVDSVKRVTLDLAGIYELHTWAGNSVMIENNIEISHASPEILDFLIKEGRYDVVLSLIHI